MQRILVGFDPAGNTLVLADCTLGSFTLLLPDVRSLSPLCSFTIVKTDSGANSVTVASILGQKISGSASVSIDTQFNSVTFNFDQSTGYYVTLGSASSGGGVFGMAWTARYPIDAYSSAGTTQIHLSKTDADSGGYLLSISDQSLSHSAGAAWSGTAWVAKAATAVICSMTNGSFQVFCNTGLTAGNAFTALARLNISSSGTVALSSLAGTGSRIVSVDANGLMSATYVNPWRGSNLSAAPSSPVDGQMYSDTTRKVYVYGNTAWMALN